MFGHKWLNSCLLGFQFSLDCKEVKMNRPRFIEILFITCVAFLFPILNAHAQETNANLKDIQLIKSGDFKHLAGMIEFPRAKNENRAFFNKGMPDQQLFFLQLDTPIKLPKGAKEGEIYYNKSMAVFSSEHSNEIIVFVLDDQSIQKSDFEGKPVKIIRGFGIGCYTGDQITRGD